MALGKLDWAIVAVMAAGLLWIEHAHRSIVGTPAAAKVPPSAASVCPDTDDVPFSTDCIKFINGGVLPDLHSRPSAPVALPDARDGAELRAPACPASNENAPYSANCIKFLSGWYWQANPAESTP